MREDLNLEFASRGEFVQNTFAGHARSTNGSEASRVDLGQDSWSCSIFPGSVWGLRRSR